MSEQKEESPKKMSKEEVEKRKAEMTAWHKEQIPFLETQFQYEDLLTKIQQAHTNRLEAEYKWIQLKAAMMENLTPDEVQEKPGSEAAKEPTMTATRTLKKEPNANQ
jgi:hypothetical protein